MNMRAASRVQGTHIYVNIYVSVGYKYKCVFIFRRKLFHSKAPAIIFVLMPSF